MLGPLELRIGGRVREVGQPRRRAVLAALATDAGRPVPVDTLIDRVWDADPPDGARSVLYAHISRLRRLLEDAASIESECAPRDGEDGALRIVRASGGYVLEADENAVDLLLFRALVARGRLCPTEAERVRVLEEALRLWRGAPLPEQTGAWTERMRTVWTGERIEAALAWAEALLHEGRPQEVPALLRPLAAEHPLSEPLAVMLVRALGEAGRTAEAVHAYTGIRRQLADELGIPPGRELRAMYAELLSESDTGQPSAEPRPAPAPAVAAASAPIPTQLPMDVRPFTGRDEQLAELTEHLLAGEDARRTAAVVRLRHRRRRQDRPRRALGAPDPRHAFPTGSSTSTCADSTRTAGARPARRSRLPRRARRFRGPHPAALDARAALYRTCSPDGGCSSCSTTPPTPTRSARCCPAAPAARAGHQPRRADRAGRRCTARTGWPSTCCPAPTRGSCCAR